MKIFFNSVSTKYFFTLLSAFALFLATAKVTCASQDMKIITASTDLTEMSVEQLLNIEVASVYTASKYDQKVTDAPASVSIITENDIKQFGYRTLADALRSVPGFYITNDRNYNYIGVRGFSRPGDLNTRILLLVDGHRINDNVYESAPIGTEFPIDVDLIERIEVIQGPGSSLYGTNAFFGVINVITRQGSDLQGVEVSGAVGSFNTYNSRISYGNEFNSGLKVLLSASLLSSRGQDLYSKEFAAINNGIAENADSDKNHQFFAKLDYQDFTLTGVYGAREKRIPTASFESVFNTSKSSTYDEHDFLDLKYSHTFPEETDVMARIYLDRSHYRGDYLYENTPQTINRDIGLGSWWGSEIMATRKFFERHKVTVGTEYRSNFEQIQRNYDLSNTTSNLDDSRRSNIWAIYAQDEVQILKNLVLTAGLRHDHYESFGGSTNWRTGIIYKPLENSTLKFLYGEAFRAPNAYELYYQDGITQTSNPDLKPEKIRTYQAIYEQYLGQTFRSSLSGFYYQINNLITVQTDPVTNLDQFQNTVKVETRGVALELENKWSNGLRGRLNYTYQNTKNAQTGNTLSNSPLQLCKLNLSIPFFNDKLSLGVEEQFTGSRTSLAGTNSAAFFITNLTLFSNNLLPGLELSANLYNLFGKRYGDPGSTEHRQDFITQDGRVFRVKLSYFF